MSTKTVPTKSRLTHLITTFGYQMAEMGRQRAFAEEARNRGDYDAVKTFDSYAEVHRFAANETKKEIDALLLELYKEIVPF